MERDWRGAVQQIDGQGRSVQAAAILRAAARSQLLHRLRTPTSAEALGEALQQDVALVRAVLDVLRQLEVVSNDAGAWSLTPEWASLASGDSPVDWVSYQETVQLRAAQLEGCLDGSAHDYWQLPPSARLTMARGVTHDPTSPLAGPLLRRDLAAMDGVTAALEAGGRVLELGCGVGARITSIALEFPAATVTGVELDAGLVEWGRARAAALGLADRLEYVVGDAADYLAPAPVDLVNWSQFFFPTPSRAPALAAAHRALRPGGWVSAPVAWAETPPPDGDEALELALEEVHLRLQGIPPNDTAEVGAEMRAAGFVDVQVVDLGFVSRVQARKP